MLEEALSRVPKLSRASQDKTHYPFSCLWSFTFFIFTDLLYVYTGACVEVREQVVGVGFLSNM